MARTTETARVTARTRQTSHVIGRLPTPAQCSTVFVWVEIRLARVNSGTKKNAKFLNRLLKKERLGTARARPVTKKTGPMFVCSFTFTGASTASTRLC